MAFGWAYSGPSQVILPFRRGIMSTKPGEPETPVRARFSDPDGGMGVLVPERDPKTAEFLGALFGEVFGKEAGSLQGFFRKFFPAAAKAHAPRTAEGSLVPEPKELPFVKDIAKRQKIKDVAATRREEEARRLAAVPATKEQKAFETAPSKLTNILPPPPKPPLHPKIRAKELEREQKAFETAPAHPSIRAGIEQAETKKRLERAPFVAKAKERAAESEAFHEPKPSKTQRLKAVDIAAVRPVRDPQVRPEVARAKTRAENLAAVEAWSKGLRGREQHKAYEARIPKVKSDVTAADLSRRAAIAPIVASAKKDVAAEEAVNKALAHQSEVSKRKVGGKGKRDFFEYLKERKENEFVAKTPEVKKYKEAEQTGLEEAAKIKERAEKSLKRSAEVKAMKEQGKTAVAGALDAFEWLSELGKIAAPTPFRAAKAMAEAKALRAQAKAERLARAPKAPVDISRTAEGRPGWWQALKAGIKGEAKPERQVTYKTQRSTPEEAPKVGELPGGGSAPPALESPRRPLDIKPTMGENVGYYLGKKLYGAGKKIRQAATPEPVSAEESAKVLGAQKFERAAKAGGKKEDFYVSGKKFMSPEDVEKLSPRFRWAMGKFTDPEKIKPGEGVKGEILPSWAGLPSFGIARRLAKGRGIEREFASKGEAEAAKMPGAYAAGAHAFGLPLRGAKYMLKGLYNIPRGAVRAVGGAAVGLKRGMLGQPMDVPEWKKTEFAPYRGTDEELIAAREAMKKIPRLGKHIDEHLRNVGDKTYISREGYEAVAGEKGAKDVKWGALPKSFAERAKKSPVLTEGLVRATEAQRELEKFNVKPREEQERILRNQPGQIEQWRAEAGVLKEQPGERAKRYFTRYERTAPTPTQERYGKTKGQAHYLEGLSPVERAKAMRAQRIGETPEGTRKVEPILPGTKPAFEMEKQRKAFSKALGKTEKEMGLAPETKAEPEAASGGRPKGTAGATIGGEVATPLERETPVPSRITPAESLAEPQTAPQAAPQATPGTQGMEGLVSDLRMLAQRTGGGPAVDPNPISHALRSYQAGVPMSEEARNVLMGAQTILQKTPNVNMKQFAAGTLKRIKDPEARAQVQQMFSEWESLAPSSVNVITKGTPGFVSSVLVPEDWAQKAIEKNPFLEGSYLKKSTETPGKYVLQDLGEKPRSAAVVLAHLRKTPGLEGKDEDFAGQFTSKPGTYAAGMPGAGPQMTMMGPEGATAGAPGAGPGGGGTPPPQPIRTPSGHTVDTNVLADLLGGDWQSTPKFKQFLQQQVPGYKQPGGFGQAMLGTASMMIPMMLAQSVMGNSMGGMGGYMAGMALQQPMHDILSNVFGYASGADPRIAAARRAYLMQMLAQRGFMGQPGAAPAPAPTPAPATQATVSGFAR